MLDLTELSNRHRDLAERDAQRVYGWRFEPRVVLERGEGVFVYDVDGNGYIDLSAGMMCMVLGHSHPELTEVVREQAATFVPTASELTASAWPSMT